MIRAIEIFMALVLIAACTGNIYFREKDRGKRTQTTNQIIELSMANGRMTYRKNLIKYIGSHKTIDAKGLSEIDSLTDVEMKATYLRVTAN